MKKGKCLLVIPMCLLLCLGACNEVELEESDTTIEEEPDEPYEPYEPSESEPDDKEETFEVVETDIEKVITAVSTNGVDTSLWNGLYYDNLINEYINLGYYLLTFETIHERTIYAPSGDDFTLLYESLILYLGQMLNEYSEYEYFDGATLYGSEYGESYSFDIDNLNPLSYLYMPYLVIYQCIYEYIDFYEDPSSYGDGFSLSGSISEGSEGSSKISLNIDAKYIYQEGDESMEVEGYMLLDLYYDEDLNFVNLVYTLEENETYDDGSAYLITQSIEFHDYLEESVPEPDWLDTYFPDR